MRPARSDTTPADDDQRVGSDSARDAEGAETPGVDEPHQPDDWTPEEAGYGYGV
jgi:hypothetical protein